MFFEDCVFFDLETVPNMTRFVAPKPRTDSSLDLIDVVALKVNDLKDKLPLLSLEELKILHELEEAETNRVGVKQAIKSETQKLLVEQEQAIKQWSTDPWKCQICCLVWYDTKKKVYGEISAVDKKSEIELLYTWYRMMKFRKRITWGGLRFDDQVIIARTLILGLSTHKVFPISVLPNWRNEQHTDLSQIMGDRKLKDIGEDLGISPASSMDGSMVYQAFRLKRYDEIAEYCKSDVDLLMQIAERIESVIAL